MNVSETIMVCHAGHNHITFDSIVSDISIYHCDQSVVFGYFVTENTSVTQKWPTRSYGLVLWSEVNTITISRSITKVIFDCPTNIINLYGTLHNQSLWHVYCPSTHYTRETVPLIFCDSMDNWWNSDISQKVTETCKIASLFTPV